MPIKQPRISEAYIKFPTGRLSLKEVQQIFSTIPFEIDLIDSTDHFAWYSDKPNREHVRDVASLGEPVTECHPPKAVPAVMAIINSFRDGKRDVVTRPLWMNGHRSLIQYYALRDIDGHYLGTIEFTGSVEYILNLFEKGAWDKGGTDASTGASQHEDTAEASDDNEVADASTGASESSDDSTETTTAASEPAGTEETDADTGASESGSVDADDEAADATTGASEEE